MAFGVLGPVEAAGDRGPVPLRGSRQRAVLARLLIAQGRVVPVDRLADDLWREPPEGAVAAIRTFVADLRRALEPGRAPREPARLLVTAPPGYALRVEPDSVDAWRFEAAVVDAGQALTAGRVGQALASLDGALGLWRGPAYSEFAGEAWARAEIDRLDELRMLAVERRAAALLGLGRSAEAVSDLQAHVAGHPLREDAWQLLATALYRSGRQGDALAALRRARATLVAELGVDPGPGLRRLESDILAQAPHLTPGEAAPVVPVPVVPAPVVPATVAPVPVVPEEAGPGTAAPGTVTPGEPSRSRRGAFVGRGEELTTLYRLAEGVVRHRAPALALISGEAGAGKTALAEALTRQLSAGGWTAAWGRIPEYEGAPAAWPWGQIAAALEASAPEAGAPEPAGLEAGAPETGAPEAGTGEAPGAPGSPGADPAAARFHLRRAAAVLLTAAAGRSPVLVVTDDLHRADEDTLDLLTALFAEPVAVTGPVLVVGTFRATEVGPELTGALARFARAEPVRVYLSGLSGEETGELARAVAGADLDEPAVRLIHQRSGGNPFFVRELARLLATEGGAALGGAALGGASLFKVPPGVRDVIRHRLTRLPDAAQTVLRQASVLGRDVDPDVLAALAGDGAPLLDALEHALRAGFLTEYGPDGRLRFTHILVRDTLYADLSALRRARWHAAAGEALERLYPHDVATLAHHFVAAASPGTATRAARYAGAAAAQAERVNPHQSARLWRQAVEAHDRAGGTDSRGRLAAVMGLGRTLAVTGHLDEARRYRLDALAAAEKLDDPALTASVLAAFEVPASWTRNDDEQLSGQIVRAAERILDTSTGRQPEQRSRLLSTLALELRGTTTDGGRRAAAEAEALARTAGDPALLAFALNARFMHTFHRTGLAAERARIGAELVEVAARSDLVTFEVLGHLVLLQAHSALADFVSADAHASAADRLADRYDLPLVSVFTGWYGGLRLAVGGRTAEAEAAYRAVAGRLSGSGMPGMERGLPALALLSVRLTGERLTGAPPNPRRGPALGGDGWAGWDFGPEQPWVRPLILLSDGREDDAAAALRGLPASPHDLLREARLCLAARAAVALDDRATMRYLHAELLPAAGELAGAGSGVLTLGPVADHLDALAAALG
ncbi:hypothetical protein Raf01_43520 [Rugosimonospora africana]|uniref:OmpR/PhoB-type domain-containing protein n=1 Tax=Rugosimonospora africana TaxID=556532 RepID=A0A8J3VRG8_9ACTN|nr:hypothetical protein Raf01_43520 [Rugosimonospora africana]